MFHLRELWRKRGWDALVCMMPTEASFCMSFSLLTSPYSHTEEVHLLCRYMMVITSTHFAHTVAAPSYLELTDCLCIQAVAMMKLVFTPQAKLAEETVECLFTYQCQPLWLISKMLSRR